jgi:hypothetical protein
VLDQSMLEWRTSSYSASQTNCVEVGWVTEAVAVRDSKNVPGPALSFSTSTWRSFLSR